MKSKSDRLPTSQGSARARCPVCHETVYSRAGIHPQCAVRQSELSRPRPQPPAPAAAEAGERAGPPAK
jgi:hypothetical protein